VRGQVNEPAFVVHTLAALAHARDADLDELARQVDANAAEVFGL
jgi:Tat protein secretion system quality control protein TatD with DNase activity